MLRRIIAIFTLMLLPGSALAALPSAPVPAAPVNISGALFDQVTQNAITPAVNRKQGVSGYTMTFHDSKNQYTWPVCYGANLVEVDGRKIEPTGFAAGDNIVVSARPNAASNPAVCIDRVVRQDSNRSSGGECLRNFQIKHEIQDAPATLRVKAEYTYILRAYARPTLDCDAQAYGTSPITTTVAANRPFIVSLTRETTGGVKELSRWSLTTDAAGRASFTYTFTAPSDTYKFQVAPGGNGTPGDVISWSAKVVDPRPSPSLTPSPAPQPGQIRLTATSFIVVLIAVLGVAIGFETRYWLKKRREHELPEQEYRRTPRL